MSKLLALGLALIGLAFFFRRGWLLRRRQRRLQAETEQRAADKILNACRFSSLFPIEFQGQPAWIDLEHQCRWSIGAPSSEHAAASDFTERLQELAQESECQFVERDGQAECHYQFRIEYPDDLGPWMCTPLQPEDWQAQFSAGQYGQGQVPRALVQSITDLTAFD